MRGERRVRGERGRHDGERQVPEGNADQWLAILS